MTNKIDALMKYRPGGQQAELFEQKLQEQTGWDKNFCTGAIEEYKRFVYLASVSDSPITPSIIVDEVWHLHLTFSRCYWDDMCDKVLGYRLHHDPAMPSEQGSMNGQYLSTHELYERHFDQVPPCEYWPRKSQEPKVEKGKGGWLSIALAAVFSLFLTAAATASETQSSSQSEWIFWIIVAAIGILLLRSILKAGTARSRGRHSRYSRRAGRGTSAIPGCSTSSYGSHDCGPSDGGGPSCGGGAGCGGGGCGGGG